MTRKKTINKETPSILIDSSKPKISKKEQITSIVKSKTKDKFLSQSQKDYYDKLIKNQITICSGPAEDPVHPMELLATMYHACGIDPETIVHNHLNQPRELVKAKPVTKLFA